MIDKKLELVDQVLGIGKHEDLIRLMEQYFDLDYEVRVDSNIVVDKNPFGNYKTIAYDLYIYREKAIPSDSKEA